LLIGRLFKVKINYH